MCNGITKSGKVCKIKSETRFCHIHQTQETYSLEYEINPFFFFRDLMRESHSELFNNQCYNEGIKSIWPNRDYIGYPYAKNDPEKKQTLKDLRVLQEMLRYL